MFWGSGGGGGKSGEVGPRKGGGGGGGRNPKGGGGLLGPLLLIRVYSRFNKKGWTGNGGVPKSSGMDYIAKARRVFEIEIEATQAVATRLDAGFGRAVELIRECVEARGKVVVVGVGKSGHVGEKI